MRLLKLARKPRVAVPLAVVLLASLATVLGLAYGLGVATFVVVVYTAIFSAVAVLGYRPFAALPDLDVALRVGVETTRSVQLPVRPMAEIDIEACIEERVAEARGTVTPAPTANPYTGLDPMRERYDRALARFNTDLAAYAAELRAWLEGYEARRWPSYSLVRAHVAIENNGQSVADGVTLRLTLPDGLAAVRDEDDLSIPPAPKPLRFEQRNLLDLSLDSVYTPPPLVLPKLSLPSAPSALMGPELLIDRGSVTAQFRVETVTHGVTAVSRNPLLVTPTSPGTYVLAWEAHVGNLRHPARGTLSVRVDERTPESFKLDTLAAVLATREVRIRED
jgi:hypothetical protein